MTQNEDKMLLFSTGFIKQKEYWRKKLSGDCGETRFPLFSRGRGGERCVVPIPFPGDLSERLIKLGKQSVLSIYIILLSGLKTLLSRYRFEDTGEVTIVSPLYEERVSGNTLNTHVFIRDGVSPGMTFKQLILAVRESLLGAYENQDYPVEQLLEYIFELGEGEEPPVLSRIRCEMRNIHVIQAEGGSDELLENRGLVISFGREGGEIDGRIESMAAGDNLEYLRNFAGHYVNLLNYILPPSSAPRLDTLIGEIPMDAIVSEAERRRLTLEFNRNGESEYPRRATVHGVFEAQVERTPHGVALEELGDEVDRFSDGGELNPLTYKELNRRADVLAQVIRNRMTLGGASRIAGILADAGAAQVTGLLAILKSGNSFVPVNPLYPRERIGFIVRDCNIDIFLTDRANEGLAVEMAESLPGKGVEIIVIEDALKGEVAKEALTVEPPAEISPLEDQFCYVIYTSGSTGKPKGVPITNGNLIPLLYWGRDYFGLGEHTRVLQNLSYAFDFGIFEIFTTILFGGALYFQARRSRGDATHFAASVNRRGINTIHTTPGFFSHVVSAGVKMPSVRIVHYGGDVLTPELVRRTAGHVSEDSVIYNGYGPTEATINSTIYAITAKSACALDNGESIPIGKPSARNDLYILDSRGELLPVGAPGELHIAGERIAPGYLNRPELTAEKFEQDLTDFGDYQDNNRSYKTGDLARWLPDGNIEFLGRIDQQVKIRGYRIELGEIEARLAEFPGIEEALIIDRQDASGGKYLCAYYVLSLMSSQKSSSRFSATPGTGPSVSDLKQHLSNRLPDYMVPSYFIQLQEIPLTPNGKIDRNALPDPDPAAADRSEYVPPGDRVERELVKIWARLLFRGGEEAEPPQDETGIGIDDDFFELGGDSLLANRVVARIRQAFDVELSLRDFFERPVIRSLSEEIRTRAKKVSRIEPAERTGPIPLSFAQERLWFLHQLDHRNQAYHVPRALRFEGPLEVEVLEAVFTEIVRRHEILRTVFPTIDGQPVQEILEPYPFKIPVENISGEFGEKDTPEQESYVARWLREEGQRPFDLEKDGMLRITLLRLAKDDHILVSTEHHLVHDGWTQGVLLREFLTLFAEFREGRPSPLPPLPIQYADYAIWQRNHFQGETLTRHLETWKEKLAGLKSVLDLPLDRTRPPVISGRGVIKRDPLPQSMSQALKEYGRQKGTTLFMTMLAAFKVLLNRWTGETDICVGTGAASRQHEEMEGMLGMVINTVALRTRIEPDAPFETVLQAVKETCVDSYAHEDTPFEKVVAALQPERSMSYTPLFQVFFTFMDVPQDEIEMPGLEVTPVNAHNRSAKFDINVTVIPLQESEGGEILVDWEYNTDILEDSTMERMLNHYRRLLSEVLNPENADIPSCTLPMMEESEIRRLVDQFNDTEADYPADKTIHRLFEEQVQRTPDRIAVTSPPGVGTRQIASGTAVSITYWELNRRADRLAHVLKEEKGVGQGDIVAVKIERSSQMMIAIYAVIKAGAVYLPISPGAPAERTRYMMEDSNAATVLTAQDISGISQETVWRNNPVKPTHPLTDSSTQPCYIIYTSGSTGRPKGVQVSHRALVNRLNWMQRAYPIGPGDRLLQKTPVTFDVSLWELFWWGIAGASLALLVPGEEKNPAAIVEAVEKQNVTAIHFVPSMLTPFLDYVEGVTGDRNHQRLNSLKRVFSSGEALEVSTVETFNRVMKGKRLINLYGPTEAAVDVTYHDCPTEQGAAEEKGKIPIGKPIDNIRLYILDRGNRLQPIGVYGELAIAGAGLADGYINKPELTAETFEQDLADFGDCTDKNRCYKTGDRARWLEDGNIEYGGRLDRQVKIRGFRIEPGEIENRLLQYERVEAAAVTVKEDPAGGKKLIAYIVPYGGNVVEFEQWEPHLKEYLSQHQPDYMIPAYFIALEELPLTTSGKLDRNALPEPGITGDETAYEAPQNSTEEILADIWSDVLAVPKVGRNDHFFRLGGDSIKVIQVANRLLKKRLKIENRDLFQEPTLKKAAKRVRRIDRDIPQDAVQGEVPLTPIQAWFFENDFTDPQHFNHAVMLQREEGFREDILEKAFDKLTEHHDALRMEFRREDENREPLSSIHQYNRGIETVENGENRNNNYELEVYDIPDDYEPVIREKADQLHSSLNLETGPLVKLGLFKTPGVHHLLIVIHHLVVDGVSWRILLEDFQAGYRQAEKNEEIRFQPKTDSFRTWALRLSKTAAAMEENEVQNRRKYWEDEEQEEADPLPEDYEVTRENKIQHNMQSADMQLSREETGVLLKEVHQAYNTEINDILLAALGLALNKWGQIEKIRINLEGHGRESIIEGIDISRTVGWFTSRYPVNLEVRASDDLSKNIKTTKERLRRIPDKGIGYGILRYLTPAEKKKGYLPAPPPSINFNYMGQLQQAPEEETFIRQSHLNPGNGISPRQEKIYQLDIGAKVIKDQLKIEVMYNSHQYEKETINRLTASYEESLREIIAHCTGKDEQELTPSDLVYSDLDIDSLDEIKGLLEGIE